MSEVTGVGREGVTCTVCHQIEAGGPGQAGSFTGSFTLGTKDRIYGPFPEPFTAIEAGHVLESALCGTCHTVITHPRDGQSCHMSALDAWQFIAHRPLDGTFRPTSPRSPFGQHLFAGGNALIPAVLGNSEMETGARQQLGRALRLDVMVTNLTGHKLPTAYPSRRLWIHLRAADAAGKVAFESGAWDQAGGKLIGDAEPGVFEAEYVDAEGRPTVSVLEAARYGRDTRIMPAGFRAERLLDTGLRGFDIAPVGVPGGMEFRPGSATVTYRIPSAAPLEIVVEALFQTIKPGHQLPALAIPANLGGPTSIARTQVSLR